MTTPSLLVLWTGLLGFQGESTDHQDSTVQDAVRRVLEDPEFRHLTRKHESVSNDDLPEWLKSFLEWLASWFESDSSSSSGSSFTGLDSLFSLLAIGLVAGVIIFLIVGLLKQVAPQGVDRPFDLNDESEAINPLMPPGEYPTAFYEQRALQFATEGNYRAAFRELVLGGMSWTERVGRIRYRRGLTNRDYVRANWSDRERQLSLMVIVEAFDRVFFGRKPAEQRRFERCLAEFQQSFRETLPG